MTQDVLLHALDSLEGDWLEEALCRRAELLPRAARRIKPLTVRRLGTLAACLAVILTVGLYVKTAVTPSHEPAPLMKYFATVEAVEGALGKELLLRPLEESLLREQDIHVSYAIFEDYHNDDGHEDNTPLMLNARYFCIEDFDPQASAQEYSHVELYILFDKNNVNDSYIAGYEEQGLSKQYGEITVVYSLIEDGMMHGQAKFLYEGNLYVLDVNSTGQTHRLMTYLELLLGEVDEP